MIKSNFIYHTIIEIVQPEGINKIIFSPRLGTSNAKNIQKTCQNDNIQVKFIKVISI